MNFGVEHGAEDFDGFGADAAESFGERVGAEKHHRARFGFAAAERSVVIEAVRVEARMASIDAVSLRMPQARPETRLPTSARAWFGGWVDVPLVRSSALHGPIAGPALIVEPNSTLVLERGWQARRLAGGELMLDALVFLTARRVGYRALSQAPSGAASFV